MSALEDGPVMVAARIAEVNRRSLMRTLADRMTEVHVPPENTDTLDRLEELHGLGFVRVIRRDGEPGARAVYVVHKVGGGGLR